MKGFVAAQKEEKKENGMKTLSSRLFRVFWNWNESGALLGHLNLATQKEEEEKGERKKEIFIPLEQSVFIAPTSDIGQTRFHKGFQRRMKWNIQADKSR